MVKYEFIVSIVSSMEFNFVNKQSSVCVCVCSKCVFMYAFLSVCVRKSGSEGECV